MNEIFPTKKIVRLLEQVEKTAKLSAKVSSDWSRNTIDRIAVMSVFKPFHVKNGFILCSYQFRTGEKCQWALNENGWNRSQQNGIHRFSNPTTASL